MQETAGRFSFFEEALLGFEVQSYRRVAAAVKKAVQCYCVIDGKNYPDVSGSLFQGGR